MQVQPVIFIYCGQTLGNKTSGASLPNFFLPFKNNLSQSNFSYSINPAIGCHAISFTAAANPAVSCAAANFSVTNIAWNFGDLLSGSSNTSTANNPIHTYPSAGNYTVMQILYYPCGSDTIKQVVSVPPPNVSVVSSPGCSNSSGSATVIAFGGVGPYSYTWIPSMQTNSIATNLATGVYSVTVFDQGLQCAAKTTVAVNNFSLPPITVQPSTLVPLCIGSQTVITLSGLAGGYSWTPSIGLSSAGNGIITISSTTSQNYTIASSTNSCVNQAVFTVSVLPLPNPTIVPEKTVSCANSSLMLVGSGGGTYLWKLPDQTFTYWPILNTVLPSSSGNYIYTLQATDANGCSSNAYQTIQVQPLPDGYLAGFKPDGCVPFCATYSFVPSLTSAAVSSTWVVNGLYSVNSASFCLFIPGYYTLSGNLMDNTTLCKNEVSSQIVVYQKPEADFSYLPENIAAEIDEAIFTARGNYYEDLEYEWNFLDGSKVTKMNGYRVQHVYEETGTYPVALTIKNKHGCIDTAIKVITVNLPRTVFIPNSFTPNGDNLNDEFKPLINGGDLRRIYFVVYNRWGEKLFETNQREQGWDGTYKGTQSSSDIYIWKLSLTYYDTGAKTYTGQMNLLR